MYISMGYSLPGSAPWKDRTVTKYCLWCQPPAPWIFTMFHLKLSSCHYAPAKPWARGSGVQQWPQTCPLQRPPWITTSYYTFRNVSNGLLCPPFLHLQRKSSDPHIALEPWFLTLGTVFFTLGHNSGQLFYPLQLQNSLPFHPKRNC